MNKNLIDEIQDNTNDFSYLISSERSNNDNNENTNKKSTKKKVKFTDKVIIIDVECWKQYNMEQTADENFDNVNEEDNKIEENNENKNTDDNNTKKRRSKNNNVVCSCNLI